MPPEHDEDMMKRTTYLIGALLLAGCSGGDTADEPADAPIRSQAAAAPFAPSAAVEAEVVGVVQELFDALETGDDALLREVVDPSVVMHWAEHRDGTTTFGSSDVEGLATRITGGGPPLIERMWEPSVRVHGALATVWTEYDFYAGADFSHCGVDAVNLLRGQDGWRIVALSWTRAQPPECVLHPDGPPSGP